MRLTLGVLVGMCFFASVSTAEDINEIFKRVNDYIGQKQYSKALSEIEWARKELEKLHASKLEEFFPATVAGYSGGELRKSSALGITNIERSYSRSGGSAIEVSLTGGSSEGAAQALGGIMAFGKMAAMMDSANQESFRIQGRTATLAKTPGSQHAELSIFLDSGSIVRFQSDAAEAGPMLKSFAESLKISELDAYLRG